MQILAKLRIAVGLTQMQLAEAIGVERSTIAKWESGVAMPRSNKLPLLAKLYGCSIDELFEQKGGNEMRNSNASERD